MNLRNHVIKFFAPLAIILSLYGCSVVNDPVTPQWETTFHMPLSSDTYTVSDLIRMDQNMDESEKQTALASSTIQFPSHVFANTFPMYFTDENKNTIDKTLGGDIIVQLESRLPADVNVQFYFLDAEKNITLAPMNSAGVTASVSSAKTLSNNNEESFVTKRTESRIQMSAKQLRDLFSSAYLNYQFDWKTANGEAVTFTSSNYIKIRSLAIVQVRSDIITK